MKNGKLRVALVGVSFGAEFVPIYLKHPDVDSWYWWIPTGRS